MNAKRSTHYVIQSRTWVSDLWGAVTCGRMSFQEYLEAKKRRVMDRFPKTVPQYVRDLTQAYETAFYHIHTSKMLYAHEYKGRAYFTWNDLPEAGRETFRQSKGKSAHVWPGPECVSGVSIEKLRLWGDWQA